MKVQLSFTAETPEELQKLQATLAAFVSGNKDSAVPSFDAEPEAPKTRKTKAQKEQAPVVASTAPVTPSFDFSNGAGEDHGEFDFENPDTADANASIDLEAIRDLANAKAAQGHGNNIRNIMGSFAIAALSALKPAQYAAFHKSISALK